MIKKIFKILLTLLWVFFLLLILTVAAFTVPWKIHESETNVESAPENGYFVDWGDVQIFIQEEWPKDWIPVVFVHGTASWWKIWKHSTAHLSWLWYRTFAIDLPPFGYSTRPENADYSIDKQAERILKTLDSLELNSSILVWHSFWAKPTVEAALKSQEKIQWLVIVDWALWLGAWESSPQWSISKFIFESKYVLDPLIYSTLTNPFLSKYFLEQLIHNKSAATDWLIKDMQEPTNIVWTTTTFWDWLEFLLYGSKNNLSDSKENYTNIVFPTWIIWWKYDTITPLEQWTEIDSLIPASELFIMDDVWHLPHIENIDLFNEKLVESLNFIKNTYGK